MVRPSDNQALQVASQFGNIPYRRYAKGVAPLARETQRLSSRVCVQSISVISNKPMTTSAITQQ